MKKPLYEPLSPPTRESRRRAGLSDLASGDGNTVRLSKEDVRRFLREESLFRRASSTAIERLADVARAEAVARGDYLFHAGDPCDSLHLVMEGCGLLVKGASDGRRRILHRALPGEIVGAVPFFDRKEYPANFYAETDCVVLAFARERLLSSFSRDPSVSLAIIGTLVERLRMMASMVEKMSFEDAEHRLWDYLVETSSRSGTGEYPRIVEPLPTRERIATVIGTVREVVSRRLSRLADSGHIRIEGRRVLLLKALK